MKENERLLHMHPEVNKKNSSRQSAPYHEDVEGGLQKDGKLGARSIEYAETDSIKRLFAPFAQFETEGSRRIPPPQRPVVRHSNKRALFMIVFVWLVIILGGFASYFLWPRQPAINILSFKFDDGNPTSVEGDQLFTNWIGKVAVKSPNYFDIAIRELNIKAFLPQNQRIPVALGKQRDIVIRRNGQTTFDIKFKVPVYQPSSGKPSLVEECINHSKAKLLIDVDIDLHLLHWTGKRVQTRIAKNIDCVLPDLFKLLLDLENNF